MREALWLCRLAMHGDAGRGVAFAADRNQQEAQKQE
jgi:hypothetical protein